jgi:hypothetical protein
MITVAAAMITVATATERFGDLRTSPPPQRRGGLRYPAGNEARS